MSSPAENFVTVLSHLGILVFSGPDAEPFLQGQLSCDVTRIGPGSVGSGAYCSPKGRMLANFLLWRREDGFAMILSRDLTASVHKHISRFVLRSKVVVIDASEATVLVGAAGTEARRKLRGASVRLNDGRLLLALPAAEASDALRGIPLADSGAWRWLDIRRGLPLVTAATQDQFIPQMANLEILGGVSFEKGCYTGQEIVARSQHLGKVKRRMFLANAPALARAGERLYSDELGDQAGGTVLNAEASPEGGYDLLAVIQAASRERSTFHLGSPGGPALRFMPLPYAIA
jgi:folate-binding protein YgfZ